MATAALQTAVESRDSVVYQFQDAVNTSLTLPLLHILYYKLQLIAMAIYSNSFFVCFVFLLKFISVSYLIS